MCRSLRGSTNKGCTLLYSELSRTFTHDVLTDFLTAVFQLILYLMAQLGSSEKDSFDKYIALLYCSVLKQGQLFLTVKISHLSEHVHLYITATKEVSNAYVEYS